MSWIVLVLPAVLVLGAAMDLFTMTIPNRLSIALALVFLIAAPIAGLTWAQFGLHLAAGALMLVVGIGLFAVRILGGGDAKLLAAASLWFGFSHLPMFLFGLALVGGILAIVILLYRMMPYPMPAGMAPWAERLHDPKLGIPYAIAISGGGLMVFPQTVWFAALAGA